jgi:nicotinate-nucleotide pyrophosphorylase (carboxylating)
VAVATDTVERVVLAALAEDIGAGDVTTEATVADDAVGTAELLVKEAGVVCGLRVAETAFRALDPEIRFEAFASDGDDVEPPAVVARLTGSERAILTAERVALNFLGRLSGIATQTRRYVEAVEGTGAAVLDTRKTTPGLRALEKYAVRCGGGTNKRMGLYDVAMIKDNHKLAAGSVAAAFEAVHRAYPAVDIQVEVTTTAEALEAVAVGARFLLCDNMSVKLLRTTVEAVRGTGEQVEIEATGGLTLEAARAYAQTGVDFLSVGGLTHSSPILDVALDLVNGQLRESTG